MKDTETYIKEVYEKAKTMPEMEVVDVEELNKIDFDAEFEELLRQALLECIDSETIDLDEYPKVQFSKRHEKKMRKLFKLARKIDTRNYRTERRKIRKKIAEKKRLKKLKYS